jgi:predicted HicB family RNase H-like nuclease
MGKKRYNFRFDEDLTEYARKIAERNNKTLTEYIERAIRKVSKYKEKELI